MPQEREVSVAEIQKRDGFVSQADNTSLTRTQGGRERGRLERAVASIEKQRKEREREREREREQERKKERKKERVT